MPDITDLARALALQKDIQPLIAANDPYTEFQAVPDQIGQTVLKDSNAVNQWGLPRYSTKDKIAAGLLSGLTSGVFSGLSKNYQEGAASDYQTALQQSMAGTAPASAPEGVDPSIWKPAMQAGSIFRLMQQNTNAEKDLAAQREIDQHVKLAMNPEILAAEVAKEKALTGIREGASRGNLLLQAQAQAIEKQIANGDISIDDGLLKIQGLTSGKAAAKTATLPVTQSVQVGENADGSPIIAEQVIATKSKSPLELRMDAQGITDPVVRAGIHTNTQLDKFLAHNPDEKITKQEDLLRKSWEHPKAQDELATITSLLNSTKFLRKLNTPIGDLALAELFNRIQQPSANAIRGSVLQKTLDAQNPVNKIAGDVQRWLGGGSMNEASRKQLVDVIDQVATDRLQYYKGQADNKFRPIAKERKLNFENIIPEYDNLFGGLDSNSGSHTLSDLKAKKAVKVPGGWMLP